MLGSSIKIKIGLLHNSFSTFIRKSSNKAVEQIRNIDIKPFINNRNPQNLERLNIARKPTGYHLDRPGREFWHKLQISRKNRHVVGSVIHHTGKVLVSASSSEFGIGRHLYRAYDTSSFINVALVLAHRCFESGIYHMIIDEELSNAGVKVTAFLDKMKEEGIILSEPRQYKPLTPWSLEVMQKPWKVHV